MILSAILLHTVRFQPAPLADPSRAELVSAYQTVTPGMSFDVAVHFRIDPGWHIYWKNPGESGLTPTLDWKLPKGWKASEISWPTPVRLDTGGVITYNYENEIALPVRITVPATAAAGPVTLRAGAKWLVCREGCLPAQADLRCSIQVSPAAIKDPNWANRLAEVRSALPTLPKNTALTAWREGKRIVLNVAPSATAELPKGCTFFPADQLIEPSAPQTERRQGAAVRLVLPISPYASSQIDRLRGLLVAPKGSAPFAGQSAVLVDVPIRRKP